VNDLLLSKIAAQLLLPPGGLILAGLLGLLFWRRWWGRWLVFISLTIFWLISTAPGRDVLLTPLESAYPPLTLSTAPVFEPGTAIVLLGGGVYAKAPEYGGRDELSGHALLRTRYAAALARKTGLPVFVSGGAVLSETTETEGRIMRRYLIDFGVSAERVHVEALSRNTWENARMLLPTLRLAGIRHVLLVTSAVHMPRAVWSFTSQGIEATAAPCAYMGGDRTPRDLRGYIPYWTTLEESSLALHEYLGLVWYGLHYGRHIWPLGTFGKLSLFRPV